MKKWRLEIYLRNGMRVIVTDKSDKQLVSMFEAASRAPENWRE